MRPRDKSNHHSRLRKYARAWKWQPWDRAPPARAPSSPCARPSVAGGAAPLLFPLAPPNRAWPGCAPPNTSNRAAYHRFHPARWAPRRRNSTTSDTRRQSRVSSPAVFWRLRRETTRHQSSGCEDRRRARLFRRGARIRCVRRRAASKHPRDKDGGRPRASLIWRRREFRSTDLQNRSSPVRARTSTYARFRRRKNRWNKCWLRAARRRRARRWRATRILLEFRLGPVAPPSKIRRLRGRRTRQQLRLLSSPGGRRPRRFL